MLSPRLLPCLVLFTLFHQSANAQQTTPPTSREALQPFNQLIGHWKGTGVPYGTREEKQRGFWIEEMQWQWKFAKKKASLVVEFNRSRNFTEAELIYVPKSNSFRFIAETPNKKKLTFEGQLKDRRLRLIRKDATANQTQMLTIRLLHPRRFLYSYAVLPKGRTLPERKYQVGATRKGVAFAAGSNLPECVVSGGLGTSKVSYKGQTYYVCCGGCRTEFYANPEMYIKEYEARKAKKKQP